MTLSNKYFMATIGLAFLMVLPVVIPIGVSWWNTNNTPTNNCYKSSITPEILSTEQQAEQLEKEALECLTQESKSAIELLNKSLELKKSIYKDDKSSTQIANSYVNLGKALHNMGKHESASHHYNEALIIAENLNAPQLKAIILRDLGIIECERGKIQKALELLLNSKKTIESIFIAENSKDQLDAAKIYFALGKAYKMAGNHKEAYKYHKKALHIRMKHPEVNYEDLLESDHEIKDLKICLGIEK